MRKIGLSILLLVAVYGPLFLILTHVPPVSASTFHIIKPVGWLIAIGAMFVWTFGSGFVVAVLKGFVRRDLLATPVGGIVRSIIGWLIAATGIVFSAVLLPSVFTMTSALGWYILLGSFGLFSGIHTLISERLFGKN
jgi:hypothetical protein